MKRARPTRKTRSETRRARDLAVRPAVDAVVKGGEVKPTATPSLMLACASGKHFKEASLTN